MNPNLAPSPLRAYRHAGKLVLEIDEHRFREDAFCQSTSRVLDRAAFLTFACENLFGLVHDDDEEVRPTWWQRFSQAIGEEAANCGAGVRRHNGTGELPIDQPPELFPGEITQRLLGEHSMETPAA